MAVQRLTLFETDFKARFEGGDNARLFVDSLDVSAVSDGRDPPSSSALACSLSLPYCCASRSPKSRQVW
jgi:hypothetical protein